MCDGYNISTPSSVLLQFKLIKQMQKDQLHPHNPNPGHLPPEYQRTGIP